MVDHLCRKCGQPIHPSETGLRYYGFYTTHSEARCLSLLREENKRLTAELDEALGHYEAALQEFEARTKALPLGHEIAQRGQSTFNWRKAHLKEIRELISQHRGDQHG